MDRIVSLLPSLTEIICALDLGPRLVGRSHECDYPPEVSSLPVLTEPKLDTGAGSREIDDQVKRLVSEGISIYRVDAERLRAARPDLVLTQDHCEVCAASPRDLEQALASWTGSAPRVVSVAPQSLADVWGTLHTVAAACGVPERGVSLARSLTDRLTEIGERCGALTPRPSVVCLEWLDPPMARGNWLPELVALAGGRSLLAPSGEHSPWLEWNALIAADPDAIVLLPCGFDLARTRSELAAVRTRAEWGALRAVREGQVYLADGNQYFNRPGPRLVESAEILAEILHPEAVSFGHAGSGWAHMEI